MPKQNQQIEVLGKSITIDAENFISLMGMLKAKNGDFLSLIELEIIPWNF